LTEIFLAGKSSLEGAGESLPKGIVSAALQDALHPATCSSAYIRSRLAAQRFYAQAPAVCTRNISAGNVFETIGEENVAWR
jgi:hypothetical protein